MDLDTLESRTQEIERAVRRLLDDIQEMKAAQSGPGLQEVIKATQEDLPEEVDLDSAIEDIRDRSYLL